MPPYVVRCGCGAPARFKVAAAWSDGVTRELKTYGLCCAACLAGLTGRARARQASCRLTPGETLEAPAVYELSSGCRDAKLTRRPDLETLPPECP
ncbi:MAG: hypothetical protein ACRC33_06910 [Gemmataceae bacterium]